MARRTAHNRSISAGSSEGDDTSRLYTPSQPGYRIKRLNDAVNFAACQRDHVPCAWCGATLDRQVFDTLDDRLNPFKRLFPFDFPGQIGDWPKKRAR